MSKKIDKIKEFDIKLKKFFNTYLGTFLLCWWQVVLVATNTYQIANHKWIGMALLGFWISFFWTYNVSIVVFGNIKQRLVYSLGGMCGVITGGVFTWYYYVQ